VLLLFPSFMLINRGLYCRRAKPVFCLANQKA
jgi:hypothetical protein